MPPPRSPRNTAATRERRALVGALDAEESKRLLAALLDAHPELVAEAGDLAGAQHGGLTAEDVAEDVASALGDLAVEDIWSRSGNQPDGAYVEPIEAAWELVEKAVAPFVEDLARRARLGRREEAAAICQGALLGLYRVSQEGEFLDGWAPDSLEESAGLVIETWQKGGGRARAAPRERERAAMRAFASKALPEWTFVTRMLGRAPKRRRRA